MGSDLSGREVRTDKNIERGIPVSGKADGLGLTAVLESATS